MYLNELKLVLSKAKTLQKQEVPEVAHYEVGFVGGTNNPEYKRLQHIREAQLKTYREARSANDLIDQYDLSKRAIVGLYFGIPYLEEIPAEAEKVAPGEPKPVQ